jgi:thymidylate synthase (FAD)
MKINVLDHGYVRLVETWGKGDANEPEAGIIEAARQSTQGSFRGWERDEKLLSFLFNNKPPHSSPFEFAGMVIEIQAPILVFREWHRHRTQSYNEMSARYAPLPNSNYMPTVDRCFTVQAENRQAQPVAGADVLTHEKAIDWLEQLADVYMQAENVYQHGLKIGIPKEVARCCVPVGRYSRMRAQALLKNWLGFLILRMHPNAQWEIRQFANAVGEIISHEFPRTWQLFRGNL